jgi:hypothetical protein
VWSVGSHQPAGLTLAQVTDDTDLAETITRLLDQLNETDDTTT